MSTKNTDKQPEEIDIEGIVVELEEDDEEEVIPELNTVNSSYKQEENKELAPNSNRKDNEENESTEMKEEISQEQDKQIGLRDSIQEEVEKIFEEGEKDDEDDADIKVKEEKHILEIRKKQERTLRKLKKEEETLESDEEATEEIVIKFCRNCRQMY